MSLVKQTIEEYCEAVHPDNQDAQDKLFHEIVSGVVIVALEDMAKTVAKHKTK